jgi:hypothetical protein
MNESWTQHRANKDKGCSDMMCREEIKKGDYYWRQYDKPYPICHNCATKKQEANLKRWEEQKKILEKTIGTTPEKLAKRVLYDCTVNKIEPHQLLIALQNLMDLS